MSNLLKTATRALAFAALIATSALASPAAQAAQPAGITRTDLQRHDLSVDGHEAVQVRVDLAPDVAFPNHTHPGEEIIYVLAGSLEYDVAGKAPARSSRPAMCSSSPRERCIRRRMSATSPRASLRPTSSKRASRC
jgi:Cupin domain